MTTKTRLARTAVVVTVTMGIALLTACTAKSEPAKTTSPREVAITIPSADSRDPSQSAEPATAAPTTHPAPSNTPDPVHDVPAPKPIATPSADVEKCTELLLVESAEAVLAAIPTATVSTGEHLCGRHDGSGRWAISTLVDGRPGDPLFDIANDPTSTDTFEALDTLGLTPMGAPQ